jgi:hypothetical protein
LAKSLVILAAGIGRRYGGLKQLEPVGPGGETIMEYSAFDARRAGFEKVVFVVREETEAEFRSSVGRRLEGRFPVAYAHQRIDSLPRGVAPPPGRSKPWGTAHAVLAAAAELDGPFAVANADDFYGRESYSALGAFLLDAHSGPTPEYAMVGFRLRDTMAEAGAVSRGVCRRTADGFLEHIEEITHITKQGDQGVYRDASGEARVLPGETLVSMNLWAFRPAFMDQLHGHFDAFIREHGGSTDRECYLPSVVGALIRAGEARVRVLPTGSRWCGVTHREDRSAVSEMIRGLVSRGEYPASLWS